MAASCPLHLELLELRAVVYNGDIFTVRNGAIVYCRNPETGEELFRGRLGALGGYFAPPIGADGKVYFALDVRRGRGDFGR